MSFETSGDSLIAWVDESMKLQTPEPLGEALIILWHIISEGEKKYAWDWK